MISFSHLKKLVVSRNLRARYRYEEFWMPTDEREAMNLVIEPHVSREEFETLGQNDARSIRELLPDKSATILDYGCGVGRVSRYLLDYQKVYAVDVSRRMLKIAKRRLVGQNVVLLHVRDCSLPLPDESVDFVFSFLTLQHMDRRDVVKVVSEFQRVLREGGRCYLQFPCYGDGELGRNTRPWSEEAVRGLLKDFSELSVKQMPSTPSGEPLWVNMYALCRKVRANREGY